MVLWWVLVIVGIVALVKWQLDSSTLRCRNADREAPGKTALGILKERYARGEIEQEELARTRRVGPEMAIDPVCGMKVNEAHAAGRVSHGGRVYYFCSEHCLRQFQVNPQAYSHGHATPAHESMAPPGKGAGAEQGRAKDPTCGMLVDKATALKTERAGRAYYRITSVASAASAPSSRRSRNSSP